MHHHTQLVDTFKIPTFVSLIFVFSILFLSNLSFPLLCYLLSLVQFSFSCSVNRKGGLRSVLFNTVMSNV